MASSNIKLFDENKGNMLSDSEFSISNQRMNGLQTGVASSQLQNKAMYQASLIAYAIAQVMMQNGKNANDTDAVSAFVANLSGTMLQKVYDIATTAEAQAGVATGKWMSPALVKAAIDTLAAKAQNILSDSTKALFGLGATAVPDDVLALLKTLVDNAQTSADGKAIAVYGTYKGTGTSGSNNPNSLTFDGKPLLVAILPSNTGGSMYGLGFLAVKDAPFLFTSMHDSKSYCTTSWTGNTLSWYNSGYPNYQFNANGYTYYYVALLAAGE